MLKKALLVLVLLVAAACNVETSSQAESAPKETAGMSAAREQPEKILIHNARIYTIDAAYSTAEAMALMIKVTTNNKIPTAKST
mgnify:CR=1 FL=1